MNPLLTLFIATLLVFPYTASGESNAPAPVITVEAVRTADLEPELTLTGTVVSQRRAGLSTRAEGLVEEVLVDAGSVVEKGELLMRLDTRLAEIDLALVRAEIETARVQLADAVRQRDEVRDLAASGAFAKTEAASREAMVQTRETELAALRVREELQLERIERHKLVAPFAGSIGRKGTEEGEWVDTGATVFELVETDSLWFDIQVAQEFLPAVQASATATIMLDAHPRKKLDAKVDVVVPVQDPVSRTFLTRLTFDDAEGLAAPGMSGTAALRLDSGDAVGVTIPRDAVTRYPDGTTKVWIVSEEEGTTVARPVTVRTAGTLGTTVEVIEGLIGGERVVVRGNEGLAEGQPVSPREEQKTKGIDGL